MVRGLLFISAFLASLCLLYGQNNLNIDFVGNLDYPQNVNDIWGYVAPDSTEYALVGTQTGVSIVSLADPVNPVEIQFIPGEGQIWRDIKVWKNFMYGVSDGTSEGMLIADLSTLPGDTAAYVYWTGPIDSLGSVRRSHNIFIDEFGLAFLAGGNITPRAVLVLDIDTDPWNPQFVLNLQAPYSHDLYVRDSVIYSSELLVGRLAMYDIRRPNNVVLLGSHPTPNNFTHSCWVSDDSNYVFTADERLDAYIASFDVSDPANIVELDRYRSSVSAIPHNVIVQEDFLVVSYYEEGCIILDISRPDNMVRVGQYDTYLPEPSGDRFKGAWGVYSALPSGAILISDRQSGLYVLQPDYQRAAFFEGTVLDAQTMEPIFGAEVHIESDEPGNMAITDLSGAFKTGKAIPGEFNVVASHPEYFSTEQVYRFQNGEVTEAVILLADRRETVSGLVRSEKDVAAKAGVNVVYQNEEFYYEAISDATGQYIISDILAGTYRVYAGDWGEFTTTEVEVDQTKNVDILITRGYYDDFNFDYGWSEESNVLSAAWIRDIPVGQTYEGQICAPAEDLLDDFGEKAYVTGTHGSNALENSVWGGSTMISSPVMDLTSWESPRLFFNPWLCANTEDVEYFNVLLTNATDTVVIDTIENMLFPGMWRLNREYELAQFLLLDDQVQVHFLVLNAADSNVCKAALDGFKVLDFEKTSIGEVETRAEIELFPNPTDPGKRIVMRYSGEIAQRDAQVRVYDNLGRLVYRMDWPAGRANIDLQADLQPSLYVVQVSDAAGLITTRKVVVQ